MSNSQPQNVLTPDRIAYGISRSVSSLVDHINQIENYLTIYVNRFGALPEMNGIVPLKQEEKANELDTPQN